MTRREIGDAGEHFAAKLYRKAGYEIAARNYACRFGEIDIICENAEYIVFAEVKARELSSAYLPREAVTPQKQRRIVRSAEHYLMQHPSEKQPRFDVVELRLQQGRGLDDPRKCVWGVVRCFHWPTCTATRPQSCSHWTSIFGRRTCT